MIILRHMLYLYRFQCIEVLEKIQTLYTICSYIYFDFLDENDFN